MVAGWETACRALLVRVALAAILASLLVALSGELRPAAAAQTVCDTPTALTNGDFETPVIPDGTYKVMPQTQVPGWLTTASDLMIELWHELAGNKYNAPDAAVGAQYAELNANLESTLYQDVRTTPGETLRWELRHRGRQGTDVMAVRIGPPGPDVGLLQQGPNISDPNTRWGVYSGFYVVPPGQQWTRFAFRSVSAAQNKPTHGNFLDGISFGTSACLTTTTAAGAATANVGDLLTYTVTARNDGGNPAHLSVLTDTVPAGVTFVPGSIRSVTGSSTTPATDAVDTDTGEYDAASRTVRVRAGTGATASAGGTIQPGESRGFSYQVRVDTATADSTVSDDARSEYTDALSNNRLTSVSNNVTTVVAPAADLGLTASLTSSGVVAGRRAEVTAVASNAGPNAATAVRLTATVPAGLANISAGSPEGTCSIAGQVATCDITSLPRGSTASMRVAADVPGTAAPGTQAVVPVTVTSATYEMAAADNGASVSSAVTAIGDLGVTMSAAPATPVAGDTVTYTVPVRNQGPSTSRSVVLSDPIANGSTYLSGTVTNGGACNYVTGIRTVECTLPDIDAGATETVTIVVRLDPAATAINNAVSVSSATPDANIADNNFSVQSAGTAVADVGVSLTIGATSAYAGTSVPFTLTVTNRGPSVATNVSFNTVVPPGVRIDRDASPYCTSTACTLPGVVPGSPVVISGTAVLTADAQAGPGQASTTVISPTTDDVSTNDTSTVTFTILLRSDVGIVQTITNPGDPAGLVAGEPMRSAVTVTNDGPTRAEGVVVRQAVPAGWPVPAATAPGGTCVFRTAGAWSVGAVTGDGGVWDCTRTVLNDSASWALTFEGRLPASWTAATVSRTTEVATSSPDPASGDNTVTRSAPVTRRSDLSVSGSLTTVPPIVQSEEVRYRATVRNAGPSDAQQVIVRDEPQTGLSVVGGNPSLGTYTGSRSTWAIPSLAAGATAIIDFIGTAQGAGLLTARVTVLASESTDPAPGNDTTTVTMTAVAAEPGLGLTVTPAVDPPANQNGVRAGNTITYQYVVRNSGNLTMSGISVSGSRGGTATCPADTLAPAASMTCGAGPYPVVQADIDSRLPVTDTVRVLAAPPGAALATQYGLVTASVPVAVASPSLAVVVTPSVDPASHQSAVAVGDTITYAFEVTNNGTLTMDQIAVHDSRLGAITCPATSLAVGVTMTCTPVVHTVTQSEVDAGTPVSGSTAVVAVPAGGSATSYGPFTSQVAVENADPVLTVEIDPRVGGPLRAGDPLSYDYEISNHGNVTISHLAVVDSVGGGVNCPQTTLDVRESVVCGSAAPYRVTQPDVDAGDPIRNSALVTGQGAGTGQPPVSAQGSVPVAVAAAAPALTIDLTTTVEPAGRHGGVEAGDTIGQRYTVANTGNVTMYDVQVAATPISAGCPLTTLAVQQSMICAGAFAHPVSRADVDAGNPLSFTASVSGRRPGATTATLHATDRASVPVAPASGLLVLTVTPAVTPAAHRDAVEAGDRIEYGYTVHNRGNVTMRQTTLTSDRYGVVGCPDDTVAAGESMTCGTSPAYTVTRSDVESGRPVAERVRLTARRPGAASPDDFGAVTSEIPVVIPAPSLTVEVAGVARPAAVRRAAGIRAVVEAAAGDTVAWTYRVVNNGNTGMSAVEVGAATGGTVTCPVTTLGVRDAMTCTAEPYRVTQAQIDAGAALTETAYVAGVPDGSTVARRYGPSVAAVPVVPAVPSLVLAVTPVTSRDGVQAGDTVGFRYRVTNDGNVTMTGLTVESAVSGAADCPVTSLGVRETTTCSTPVPHTVTQEEMDRGRPFLESARAIGTRPGAGRAVSFAPVTVTVALAEARPALAAEQTATWTDTDGDGRLGTADDVISRIVVTNTGNVTIVALRITGLPADVTCDPTTVPPGGTATCVSAVYHLTRQDIAAGRRTYEARATGAQTRDDAGEVETTAPATVVTPRGPAPGDGVPPVAGPRPEIPVTGPQSAVLSTAGWLLISAGAGLFVTAHRAGTRRPAHRAHRPAHRGTGPRHRR